MGDAKNPMGEPGTRFNPRQSGGWTQEAWNRQRGGDAWDGLTLAEMAERVAELESLPLPS